MTLADGSRLGPYEILSPLGAGGMGEVWKARDTRLGRDVAIKMLPEAFAKDRERMARFDREARLLASVNHAHIAAVHGLEQADGRQFLVMELAPGESLADRLARGPLPVDEALGIARQIAEALDAAHEKGVIHRDLKPANVQLGPDGTVKLLDFGLAKALEGDPVAEDPASLSRSPTVSERMTETGVILGTPAYMSPEQARGKLVDRRTDIWAFGAVLYEMLAGRRLFHGETVSDTLAAVLKADPDWSLLPAETPPTARRLLARCLDRDPKNRLHDAADARIEIEEAMAESRGGGRLIAGVAAPSAAPTAVPRRRLPLVAAGLLIAASAFLGGKWIGRLASPKTQRPPIHSVIPLPPDTRLSGWASPVLALSRDGRKLAFVAEKEGGPQQLYVHHLDRGQIQLVPQSESAEGPVFSPDGEWVVFAVDVSSRARSGQLKKFSLETGLTQPLCEIRDYNGASWGDDGSIVFVAEQPVPLWRVAAEGGRPAILLEKVRTGAREGPRTLYWPQLLPGGHAALVMDADASPFGNAAVVDLSTHELTDLDISASFARYSPTGHILFLHPDATLLAAPFDVAGRRLAGPPVAVLKDVAFSGNNAGALAFSESGSLVYASGYLRGSGRELGELVRVGRNGDAKPFPFAPDTFYGSPRLSPDGHRIAIITWDDSIWLYDLSRGSRTRLPASNLAEVLNATWSPDGERIAFGGFRSGEVGYKIFWQKTDATGEPELVVGGVLEKAPSCWTPDGRALLYYSEGGPEERGLWIRPMASGEPAKRLLAGGIRDASVSPDGRWLAYASRESGPVEVYVERFPELGHKAQVSSGGGHDPLWSRDGREIFYSNGGRFFAVRIERGPDARPATPELLFVNASLLGYDVAPDGTGFVSVLRAPDSGIIRELHLITNWFDELERLSPTGKKR